MKLFSLLPKRLIHLACNSPPPRLGALLQSPCIVIAITIHYSETLSGNQPAA